VNPILLLPLGNADRRIVSALCLPLREVLGRDVDVREVDVDLSPFLDEQRLQYNSSNIITHLDSLYPSLAAAERARPLLLAVACDDLCIPILTFVFGEAQLGGRVGVVSYHRLQNERYGLPADEKLLHFRLVKEALHELGHLFGLVHCSSYDCVMHISTYVEDIDTKPAAFCPACLETLRRERRD